MWWCSRVRPKKRPKLSAPEPLDTVLSEGGEQRFSRTPLPIAPSVWKKIVGPNIAERTEPAQLLRGVLVVKCATSAWANELSLHAAQIVERLSAAGFAVKELRFRVGAIVTLERPPERRISKQVPPPVPLSEGVSDALGAIDDDELREAIARAAAQSLGWEEAKQKAKATRPTEARRVAPTLPGAGRESAPPDHTYPDGAGVKRGTNEDD